MSNAGADKVQRYLAHQLELSWYESLISAGFLERTSPEIEQDQKKRHNQQSNQHDSIQRKWGALKRNDFRVKLHDGWALVITGFIGYRCLDKKAKCVI